MKHSIFTVIFGIFIATFWGCSEKVVTHKVASPDGKLQLTFSLSPTGEAQYQVQFSGEEVINRT